MVAIIVRILVIHHKFLTMKKLVLIFILLIGCLNIISCDSSDDGTECGTHNGNTLYTGPQGGCYYYNGSDNKIYVDRSECDC